MHLPRPRGFKFLAGFCFPLTYYSGLHAIGVHSVRIQKPRFCELVPRGFAKYVQTYANYSSRIREVNPRGILSFFTEKKYGFWW